MSGPRERAKKTAGIGARDRRLLFAAASVMLDYPGESVLASLDAAAADIGQIACPRARDAAAALLQYLRTTPKMDAQEAYTATFDFDAECSLSLAWHRFGDTAGRAAALVELQQIYRAEGCKPVDELPDYAPLMLEFMAGCPDATAEALMKEYAGAASKLARALEARSSIYSAMAALLAECFGGTTA